MMKNGIQSWFKALGDSSCYFLSILNIAERVTKKDYGFPEIVDIATEAARRKYLKLNVKDLAADDNFYVLEPAKILELATGLKWTQTWQPASYKVKRGEYAIKCYVNGNYTHFNSDDFDSLQNSVTVKYGKLDSYRIFRKVA